VTAKEAAAQILPKVRQAVEGSHDEIKQEIGPVKWAMLWPFWEIVMLLLPTLTRIGVEVAAMEAKTHVGAEIASINSLVNTPKSSMHPGVQKLA
jgi:hypothetical protein